MIHAHLAALFVTSALLCLGFTARGPIDIRFRGFAYLYAISLLSWLGLGVVNKSFGLISISLFQLLGLLLSNFTLSNEENRYDNEI